ncbi:MAG TPA: hypothetical protein VML55_24125 [Planctomycetaceae bacterium]|nr:hypothetical protein [Planctomycetaceae bacterium]
MADANGSPDSQLAALESQLKEKDALVAALTERLEQAAEKLDRVHRTGGDRGLRMGAIPPEVIEQQVKLAEDLKQAVEQWEAMQAGAVLGRIEVQITELRDLVANGLPAGGGGGWATPGKDGAERSGGRGGAGEPDSGARGGGAGGGAGGSGFAGWEALKAGMLKADGAAAPPAMSAPPSGTVAATAEAAGEEDSVVIHIEEVPAPEPIDLPSADVDALRAAVERRDEYITYLTRTLRLVNRRAIRIPDWEALNNAPDDLRGRLEDLEKRLEENLRLAEVELSLERARLAREAAKLRLQQDQIEKELKRLKLDRPQAAAAHAGEADDNPAGRRWLRMLGMGKGGEGE